jgi:transcriptional regulator GlxA family with amidase domain
VLPAALQVLSWHSSPHRQIEFAQRPKYFDKFGRLAFIVVLGGYPSVLPVAQNSRLVMPPHRDGGQAQYVQNPVASRAAGRLAPLLQWAQSHLGQALRVEDLARHAAMSPRTFARQFRQQTGTTPRQWLTHQRLLAAQMRLEKTDDGIDAIAEKVGLQTAATLRQHFSRTLETTPTAYRRRFSTT